MEVFKTHRLVVRQFEWSHTSVLSRVLSDPQIMKFSIVGVHSSQQIENYVVKCREQYQKSNIGQWAVHCNEDDKFVGICGLNKHIVEGMELTHVSYRLASRHHGKGYAVEVTKGLIKYSRENLNFTKLFALIDPANHSSVKVAEKSGFQFQKPSSLEGFDVGIYQVNLFDN